jgi:hypothetical protein
MGRGRRFERRGDELAGHPALDDEGEHRDRAGEQQQHGGAGRQLQPPGQQIRDDQVDHVEDAVHDTDVVRDRGMPRDLQRDPDETQDHQHHAGHVCHHPVAEHRCLHR